jgi:hypothetical protein
MNDQRPTDPSSTAEATGTAPSLGDPVRLFRMKLATRLLVGLCGVIIILMGVGLLLRSASLGTWPLVLGIAVVALAFVIGRQRYLVCRGGIVINRLGNEQVCYWTEVTTIKDVRVTHGLVSARMCTLIKKDGAGVTLSDTGIGDFSALMKLLKEIASVHNISWKEEHVSRKK